MKFTIKLDPQQIEAVREEIVNQAAKDVTIKGFRKGKAPRNLVEQQLDHNKINDEILRTLIPPAYSNYITQNNLKPIGDPSIKQAETFSDSNWEFEIEIAQTPDITLGQYQTKLKQIIAPESDDKNAQDEYLNLIFDTLLDSIEVTVPQLLIDQEVNRRMSQLVRQIDQLGITLDQYASSIDRTVAQLKDEYAKIASDRLALEFILTKISQVENLTASTPEVNTFINEIEDEAIKDQVTASTQLQEQIGYSLTREKTIEFLKSLTKPISKKPPKIAKK